MESKQVLTDGNVITKTRTGKLARDTEGRTYSEVTSPKLGGINFGTYTNINISDPISGAQFTLIPETLTAWRFEKLQRATMPAGEVAEARPAVHPSDTTNVIPKRSALVNDSLPTIEKEDLGVESIEGISVRHYRETQTIAAGKIGNERALVITTEFWYAKDLQLNLRIVRNDPRFGEETMTMTDIQRTLPAPSMVESNMGAVTLAAPAARP
jgi:hypothetical protein